MLPIIVAISCPVPGGPKLAFPNGGENQTQIQNVKQMKSTWKSFGVENIISNLLRGNC